MKTNRYEIKRSRTGFYRIWDRVERQFVKQHDDEDWWHPVQFVATKFMAELENNPPPPNQQNKRSTRHKINS